MINKDEIRKVNKLKRSQMAKEEVLEKSRRAADSFFASELYKEASQIMLYIPLGNEVDVCAVMDRALGDQKTVVVPVTDAKSGEITPCIVSKDTEFEEGAFSVLEPKVKTLADMTKTDVVLVPGIAFDKHGGRVGFGKGCYDRLLETSDAVMVGVCFGFQISDEIEIEETDVKMDFLISESGLLRCN